MVRKLKMNPKIKDHFYEMLKKNIKLRNHEKVIESCTELINGGIGIKDLNLYIDRAWAKKELGRYKEAIEDCDKMIEINPNIIAAYSNRAILNGKLEEYEKVIKDYDKIFEIDPNKKNKEIYLNSRGIAKSKLGRNEEAIEDYKKAIKINPKNSIFYNNKGNSLKNIGKNEEAIENYNRAIDIDSKSKEAYNGKGNANSNLKRYEEAIENYNVAIKIDPDYKEAYNGKGNANLNLKRYEEAIENYDVAIKIDPGYKDAYNGKGSINFELKKYEEALNQFNKVIELSPKYNIAYSNRSLVNYKLEKYNEALKDSLKALEFGFSDLAFANKINSLIKLEKYVEADLEFKNNKFKFSNIMFSDYIENKIYYFLEDEKKFINKIGHKYVNFLKWADENKAKQIKNDIEKNIEKMFEKIQTEKILYMYTKINENTKKNLKNNGIYKSNPEKFNDPFDPYLKRNTFKIDDEIKSLLKKIKINCFTETHKNILMWSHYGDNHKGVCLGYKFKNDVPHILQPIDYSGMETKNNTNQINENEIIEFSLDESEILTIENLFYRKTKEWEYEKEWRLLHLDEISKQKENDDYYKEVELVEVCFGLMCSDDDKNSIKDLLKDNEGIKFYEIIEQENLKLERKEIVEQ